jgi:hypothetical protein
MANKNYQIRAIRHSDFKIFTRYHGPPLNEPFPAAEFYRKM